MSGVTTKGRELLLELKRSEWLPPYNDDGCRRVIEEMGAMYDEIRATLESEAYDPENVDDGITTGLVVHHQSLLRSKRCIIAYLSHRLEKVKQLRWETGAMIPQAHQRVLSGKESDFFRAYDGMLTSYQTAIGMDLTSDLTPPKELCVEVRVVEDCGEIMTDNGEVHLERGTTHFLRRADVEHLIRQGKLQQLDV